MNMTVVSPNIVACIPQHYSLQKLIVDTYDCHMNEKFVESEVSTITISTLPSELLPGLYKERKKTKLSAYTTNYKQT